MAESDKSITTIEPCDRALADALFDRWHWAFDAEVCKAIAGTLARARRAERARCIAIALKEEQEASLPTAGLTAMKIRQAIEALNV